MTTLEQYLDYRKRTNCFANHAGLQMLEFREGFATGCIEIGEIHYNSERSVHGGVLFTAADTIGGNAVSAYGYKVTTISSDFHYLRPCIGADKIYIRATEKKHGKNILVCSVEVSDGKDKVYAEGIFSYYNLGIPLMD